MPSIKNFCFLIQFESIISSLINFCLHHYQVLNKNSRFAFKFYDPIWHVSWLGGADYLNAQHSLWLEWKQMKIPNWFNAFLLRCLGTSEDMFGLWYCSLALKEYWWVFPDTQPQPGCLVYPYIVWCCSFFDKYRSAFGSCESKSYDLRSSAGTKHPHRSLFIFNNTRNRPTMKKNRNRWEKQHKRQPREKKKWRKLVKVLVVDRWLALTSPCPLRAS